MAEETEHLHVEVESDFVDKQTRASPVPALAELIWNALDADADEVNVEFEHADLAGGLSKIVVSDNGTAFSRATAPSLFRKLGGSWKRLTRQTPSGRQIHGQEGKGRYKAFALGRSVVWHVTYDQEGERQTFDVRLLASDLTDVEVSKEHLTTRHRGVTVEIGDLLRNFRSLEDADGLQQLSETFAIYLANYPSVKVKITGQKLDPLAAMRRDPSDYDLDDIEVDERKHSCAVRILEWESATKRSLYLCSQAGFPYETADVRFHIPGFSFSAYLRSSYIELLEKEGRLGLAELDKNLDQTISNAKEIIKAHFRAIAAEQSRSIVDEWRQENIYPFEGDAENAIESAERQVFDIVASQIQTLVPEIGSESRKGKALHLRMIKSAIERGPEELNIILQEVLGLPAKKQKEFAELLRDMPLVTIITAAKTVSERLKFLDALQAIVFDSDKKANLKERTQLHKILAQETWIFGEEYNLWVSDLGLKKVLEKHKSMLDPNLVIDRPVSVYGQKTGIVDLMFSAVSKKHRGDEIENLVVELKAPSVTIGSDEIVQITKYYMAVKNDERFNRIKNVRWNFIIISNEYDDYAESQIQSVDSEKRLVAKSKDSFVMVKTWGEIIEENRAKLQFFKERLDHGDNEEDALEFLRQRHAAFLKGVIEEEPKEDLESSTDPAVSPE